MKMRNTLLVTATMCSLAYASPLLAQPAPDAAPETMAPDVPPPPVPPHSRMMQPPSGGETWAHQPGTGLSGPASDRASNTDMTNTRSPIAPHFPEPPGGDSAGWRNYLRDADRALSMHHTGEAQQALEMAETRLLDRSTPVDAAGQPSQNPVVQQVGAARRALGNGDIEGARSAIQMALNARPAIVERRGPPSMQPGMGVTTTTTSSSTMMAPPPPPPQ